MQAEIGQTCGRKMLVYEMANEEHLRILGEGVKVWNLWRNAYQEEIPDLNSASLIAANLSGANFNEANLSGADLIEANLNGADFKNANLSNAVFSGANLRKANFSNAKLKSADFVNARLNLADFSSAKLNSVKFSNADLKDVDFSNANLSNADFSNAELYGANFNNADLTGVNLSNSNLCNVDLSNASLIGANLTGADLTGADLSRADLQDADLSRANLRGTNLSRANFIRANLKSADIGSSNLTYANLSQANLNKAYLSSANLSNANLSNANLLETVLTYTTLHHANFSNAYLVAANFSPAFLENANLCSADLSDADLRIADLSYADLSHANLNAARVLGCNLSNSTLTGACIQDWLIGLSTQLKGVKCDYIFRQLTEEKEEFIQRLPIDPHTNFAPGEFEHWASIRAAALDTIDITFTEGLDWQSLFSTLQQVRHQHPDSGIRMQSVEENGGAYVVRLRVETEVTDEALEQLKAEIETQTKALYERQLMKAETRNEVLKETLDTTLEKLAKASSNYIQGNVGSIGGNNYGSMTAHLGQATAEITQLLSLLRQVAQTFPDKERKDIEYVLDDIARDLSGPDKPDVERISRRFEQLKTIGTAVGKGGNGRQFNEQVAKLWSRLEALGFVNS